MRSLLAHATLSQLARDYTDALARAEVASRAIRSPAPLHPQPPASTAPMAPMAPMAPTAPTLNPPPPAVGTSGPRTPPTPPGAPSPDAPAPSESPPGAQPPSAASAAADVTRSADRRAVDEPISLPDSTPVFGLVSSRFGRTVSHVGHATRATHATTTQGTPPTTTTTGNTGVSPDDSPDAAFLSAHRLIDSLIGAWHAFDQRGGDWSRPDIRHDLTRLRTLIDAYLTRGADPPPRAPTR